MLMRTSPVLNLEEDLNIYINVLLLTEQKSLPGLVQTTKSMLWPITLPRSLNTPWYFHFGTFSSSPWQGQEMFSFTGGFVLTKRRLMCLCSVQQRCWLLAVEAVPDRVSKAFTLDWFIFFFKLPCVSIGRCFKSDLSGDYAALYTVHSL